MKNKLFLLGFTILVSSQFSLAGSGVSETGNSGSTQHSSGTVVPGGSANGASNAAKSASSDSSKGSMVNNIMGVVNIGVGVTYFMAYANTPCGEVPGYCTTPNLAQSILYTGMGVANLAQSGADGAAGGIADMSGADFTSSQCSGGSCGNGSGDEVGINDPTNTKATMEALKKLEKAGVKVDAKKGKFTFKGKTYDAATVTTPEGFAALGGTPAQYAAAMAANAKAEKDALAKVGGLDSIEDDMGGSGGGAGIATTEEVIIDESGMGGGLGRGGANAGDRNPTSVAGLSQTFNGEKIGVAADNIFNMIKRRYEMKDKQNSFITNDISAETPTIKN